MSLELPLVIFKWVKETSQYNADFIGYFLQFDVYYSKGLHEIRNSLLERIKTRKVQKPLVNVYDKNEYVIQVTNFVKK